MTVATALVLAATTTEEHRGGDGPDIDVFSVEAPLVPPGRYDAIGGKASKFSAHGALKLSIQWTLIADANGRLLEERVVLPRFYNVRHAPGGRFRVGRHSDYAREWSAVAGRRVSRR